MGAFDSLFSQGAQAAPTLDGILANAHPDWGARDDGSTLLRAIQANGGVQDHGVEHRGTLLPVAFMHDGSAQYDPAGSGLVPTAIGAGRGFFDALRDVATGNLQRDAYSAFGGGAPAGTQTETSRQDAQADVAGRSLAAAGTLGAGSLAFDRPPGSLGVFGGRAADAAGAERIAGNNRFVRDLQVGADQAAKEHVLSLIPPPLSLGERAVQGTKGMSVQDIMSSEPLWGYSRTIAEQQGIPHSDAFAALANHIFDAHGHGVYLSPSDAKGFMQMERLRYGQNPTTE